MKLTNFRDFTLEVFDDTHLFPLVSDSHRLSFSQKLTPTLTLGLSLGLGLGFELNPWVRVGVNFWENDKRCESETKCKRWVSAKTSG